MEYVLIALLLISVALAVRSVVKNRGNCCGNCKNCKSCPHCDKNTCKK